MNKKNTINIKLLILGIFFFGLSACVTSPIAPNAEHDKALNLASALYFEAEGLNEQDRLSEAERKYNEVVVKFISSDNIKIQQIVASALINQGQTLNKLGLFHKELVCYDDLIVRFRNSPIESIQESVTVAYYNKAQLLQSANKEDEANNLYDKVLDRFKLSSQSILIKESIRRTTENKGYILFNQGKVDEATAFYSNALKNYNSILTLSLQEFISSAYLYKAHKLYRNGNKKEIIATYEEMIQKFKSSESKKIKKNVSTAKEQLVEISKFK